MLRIRLRRAGKKNYAQYRIVVTDSRNPIQGKFISRLGHYNPHTKEVKINSEELLNWLGKGAQPSNSVSKILEKEKIKHPLIKYTPQTPKASKKKEKKEATASKAEANKEESQEDNKEETQEENKEETVKQPNQEENSQPAETPVEERKEKNAK